MFGPIGTNTYLVRASRPATDAVVVRALAHNSASFLAARADFDPHQFPVLSWRWKVVQGIPEADSNDRRKEDAPARLMVSFDGDPAASAMARWNLESSRR